MQTFNSCGLHHSILRRISLQRTETVVSRIAECEIDLSHSIRDGVVVKTVDLTQTQVMGMGARVNDAYSAAGFYEWTKQKHIGDVVWPDVDWFTWRELSLSEVDSTDHAANKLKWLRDVDELTCFRGWASSSELTAVRLVQQSFARCLWRSLFFDTMSVCVMVNVSLHCQHQQTRGRVNAFNPAPHRTVSSPYIRTVLLYHIVYLLALKSWREGQLYPAHGTEKRISKVSPQRDVTLLARRAVLPWSYN